MKDDKERERDRLLNGQEMKGRGGVEWRRVMRREKEIEGVQAEERSRVKERRKVDTPK